MLITYEQFSLSPDPASWGADVRAGQPEEDDVLHNPDPRRDRSQDKGGNIFTGRGLGNLGCLFVLVAAIVTLLYVADQIIEITRTKSHLPAQCGIPYHHVFHQAQSDRSKRV